VVAVLAGSLAALAWAVAILGAARASRIVGPRSAAGWIVLFGFLVTIPLLLSERPPDSSDSDGLGWLALAGLGYVAGMLFVFPALAGGKIPVVAPIVSTEGAVAAGLAVLAGEAAGLPLIVMLSVIAAGVFLTALEPGGDVEVPRGGDRRYAALAIAAAVAFGVGLFATGRASESVSAGWVVAAVRIAGVARVTLPLIVTRRLRFSRQALPFLVVAALAEVIGYYAFTIGTQDSIAVTAVLASQFAVIAALVAYQMGEFISRRQWAGVAIVAIGVGAVTVTRL
jgi:drug/metabolite transporter (DMT)-like permease